MSVRIREVLTTQPELAAELTNMRRKHQESFLDTIHQERLLSGIKDDRVFARVIDLAISTYGVKQADLADALGISTAAIGRWRGGKNAPAPYGREHVVATIARLVTETVAKDMADQTLFANSG